MDELELREVRCRRAGCGKVYYLCKRCDRGQWYCPEPCQLLAQQARLGRARQVWARSPAGRESNQRRQQRYREAQRRARQAAPAAAPAAAPVAAPAAAPAANVGVTDRGSQPAVAGVGWGHEACAPERVLVAPGRPAAGPAAMLAAPPAPRPGTVGRAGRAQACCASCGRVGRVVRRWAPRGRYRYGAPVRRR
jgi:hypothetical protein